MSDHLVQELVGEETAEWYSKAADYWQNVDATLDGVLGGLGFVSPMDILESERFINHFVHHPSDPIATTRALDCGAGIGRVTKDLLVKIFDKVDIVEQNPKYVEQARTYIDSQRVERFICSGLQEFTPEADRYDVIWCQWVLSHLTDAHLVDFLQRCRRNLRPHGMIFVKENVTSSGGPLVDREDYSVTRDAAQFHAIFAAAGLRVLHEDFQRNFPKKLFPVKMWALR
eukprot:GILJ01004353.1.p1 GENE.GILJ01004353.1~~GILJ01004353.1.p1  ORF type:complete len:228 (+),score=37.00 GILJ01004353.1:61-744(+)